MKNTLMTGSLFGLIGGMALTLAGCGASTTDDGVSLVDKVSIPSTPTAISVGNQNTVVAETSDGIDGALTTSSVSPVGVSLQDQGTPRFSLFDFATGRLLETVQQGLAQQQNLPAAITQSIPCDSGSMSLTINLADLTGSTLRAGDSFSVSFNNCKDNMSGSTANGSMSATVVSGSLETDCDMDMYGTCSDFSLGMSFNDLQITEMGVTNLVDGGFNLTYTRATNTNTISGDDLYMYSGTGQGVRMSNFNIASSLSGRSETTTINMTLASTRINGSVQIRSTTPLVTTNVDTDDYPSSGVLQITGANSTLTVTALDATSVQLELDADNDGTIDYTDSPVSWTTIEAAN